MRALLSVAALLLVSRLGQTFVLQPEPRDHRAGPELRRFLLESLGLSVEPRVSVSAMSLLRDEWRTSLMSAGPSAGTGAHASDHRRADGGVCRLCPAAAPDPSHNSSSSCCRRSTRVPLRELGWDGWVIYPESVTVEQCAPCGPEAASTAQCCGAVGRELVPFVYVDEWSAVVLSSVSLTRACGCDPAQEPLHPEVVTPP